MTDLCVCCICGEEHKEDDIHHIEIKDGAKDICKECVMSIKGLV